MARKKKTDEEQKGNDATGVTEQQQGDAWAEAAEASAEAQSAPNVVKTELCAELLAVEMDSDELSECSQEIARVYRERGAAVREAKAEADRRKKIITGLEADIEGLVSQITDGTLIKTVDCERRWDIGRVVVETVRLDTGEVVDSYAMPAYVLEELRQPDLPIDTAAAEAEEVQS